MTNATVVPQSQVAADSPLRLHGHADYRRSGQVSASLARLESISAGNDSPPCRWAGVELVSAAGVNEIFAGRDLGSLFGAPALGRPSHDLD